MVEPDQPLRDEARAIPTFARGKPAAQEPRPTQTPPALVNRADNARRDAHVPAVWKQVTPTREPTGDPLDISDEELFGNEAGEDEDPTVLSSYFVDKPEFAPFHSVEKPLAIVRARKGLGKSALLWKVAHDKKSDPHALVVNLRGSDLEAYGEFSARTPNQLINEWQQRICSEINLAIGKKINVALSDAAMTLVESAELAGFRDRNLVGSLLDRLQGKLGVAELKKLQQANAFQLLKRYMESDRQPYAWVTVDDVDATFVDSPEARMRVSTFFSACRTLSREVNGIIIRASVRTDVWSVIKRSDEALDKCEQYIRDISWTNDEFRDVLVKRIYAYAQRTATVPRSAKRIPLRKSGRILDLVFEPYFDWQDSRVPPDRAIKILSAGRPRWAAQLCKLAAERALKTGQRRIGMSAVQSALNKYGRHRLDDLYREHEHQYTGLQRLIESFAGGKRRFTTNELLAHITNRVIKIVGLHEIEGELPKNGAFDLARFLFKIGFIAGRQEQSSGLSFVTFEDRVELLTNATNPDDGMLWEIHPGYRRALKIFGERG